MQPCRNGRDHGSTALRRLHHHPRWGNPAGIVLDATRLGDARMQAIAADIGYAESAFVTVSGEAVEIS
ncbi:PhzF family phenazine biosynthesis protein [Arthrobacter sp. UYEF36]|uniref:PhzF family phenazine biosynthesis protein n=1 Tax=Arthrobacter sp. UYEF36 TaxID=1756366 RepID=UPI003396798F